MADIIKIYGRFSFLSLFEPRTIRGVPDSKPAYSGSIILDPSTKRGRKDIAIVEAAIEAAKQEGKLMKPGWRGTIPNRLQIQFWKDGNERDDLKKNPEYDDMMILSGRAGIDYKPVVVDRDPEIPINDPKKIVSGDWGHFAVRIYPFDTPKNGIACALNFVQLVKKGEPLAGAGDPTKIFEDVSGDDDDTPPVKKSRKTDMDELL